MTKLYLAFFLEIKVHVNLKADWKNYTGRWEVIFDPIHIVSNNAQLAASIQDYKLNT